jgi:hypothetical protein
MGHLHDATSIRPHHFLVLGQIEESRPLFSRPVILNLVPFCYQEFQTDLSFSSEAAMQKSLFGSSPGNLIF